MPFALQRLSATPPAPRAAGRYGALSITSDRRAISTGFVTCTSKPAARASALARTPSRGDIYSPRHTFATAARRAGMVEGTSSKFWEISIDGASHTVHFGGLGTNGQSNTKSDGGEKLRGLCASGRDLSELPEVTLPAAYDSWRGA